MKSWIANFKRKLWESLKKISINKSDIPTRVRTGTDANSLIRVIATSSLEERLQGIRASSVFSIMIYESTDTSKTEQLTINVIFVENGQKQSTFIGLIPLGNARADTIFNVLIKFLNECKLDFTKWVAFGSDGANVMRGVNGGVSTLLQNHLENHLITLHCVAHITALSAKVGAESSLIVKALDQLVKEIAADFGRSTKKNEQFKKIQEIFMTSNLSTNNPLRIVPFHAIRWLSRSNSINRLIKVMESLLIFYEQLRAEEGNMRYNHITNGKLLRMLYVVADILEPLSVITKSVQSSTITIPQMINILEQQKAILESLKTSKGMHETSFDSILEEKESQNIPRLHLRSHSDNKKEYLFFGHKIKYNDNVEMLVNAAKLKYITAVLTDLNERFSGLNDSTKNFVLFYHLGQPMDNTIIEESISGLHELYLFEEENLRTEILTVRSLLQSNNLNFNNFEDLSKYILQKLNQKDFPLLHFFISIILVLPFCTADCERSFSAMNLIKSDLRNKLKEILNDLMIIYTREKERKVDLQQLAKKVVRNVWKYTKNSTFSASEEYKMNFI